MDQTDEDTGIFLFKTSKAKVSTESIFSNESETTKLSLISSRDFLNGKWMKRFLKRFLTPSLLHTPVTAISSDQILTESTNLPPFKSDAKEEVVLELPLKGKKMRRVTRGNRRHKIKTRRQRNLKKR